VEPTIVEQVQDAPAAEAAAPEAPAENGGES
jgi:hypothetical protein